jgi:hypothetical protein
MTAITATTESDGFSAAERSAMKKRAAELRAYANADGKVVVFFQDSGKFNYRYSTLGFQDAANLDDGDLWPVSYALMEWSPRAEQKVAELVRAAIS